MPNTKLSIRVSDGIAVSAIIAPARAARWTYIYAPGAGSNLDDPFGDVLASELPRHKIAVVRFQFPYMEAGRRGPDRPPVLEATWRAVIDAMRARDRSRLAIGGRSMGGRIASMVVAGGVAVDALALFAYPLHPPGKPDQARDAHLGSIPGATFFCSGTRDAFGSPDELRAAARKMQHAEFHFLDGADHGFSVPKSTGRTRDEVAREAVGAMLQWLETIK